MGGGCIFQKGGGVGEGGGGEGEIKGNKKTAKKQICILLPPIWRKEGGGVERGGCMGV